MMFSEAQRILVTGASSGIGRAVALECVARGATVIGCARNAARLAEARAASVAPERFLCLERDLLSGMDSLPEWVRRLAREQGRLWGLVHAAGEGLMDTLQTYDPAVSGCHFTINFQVPMLLAQGFCDRRVFMKGGALVFIASASGAHPEKGHLTYGAVKAALANAASSISQEMAPRGVRVHTLSPGIVETPMQAAAEALMGPGYRERELAGYPLGFGSPEDVARMCAFLLSGEARWITGQNFVLAGGRY